MEIEKILKVDFVREIDYTTWMAHVVLFNEGNG